MAGSLVKRVRRVAFKVIGIQLIVVVAISLIALAIDFKTGYSVFVGGMVCVIPASYFAFKAFSVAGAQRAREVVKAFYLGEVIKLLLTVVLFIVAFKLLQVSPAPMLMGYFMTLVANWLATGFLKTENF
jgi:ATP synthase protein I